MSNHRGGQCKKANPLTIKAKTATVKYAKVKKENQKLSVSKVITFKKKGKGELTYKKVSGNGKIAISKTTGKVTVKKGLKAGTYKVKVNVKAAGNTNYKASAWKAVTFKIIVADDRSSTTSQSTQLKTCTANLAKA